MLNFLYNSKSGRIILKPLTCPFVSKTAGCFMDSRLSRPYIKHFIKKNNIDLADFKIENWKSFNEFFTRRVKDGKRPFCTAPKDLLSPCDGLLTAYPIEKELKFTVKNSVYDIETLTESAALAQEFSNGLCLVFRLTPTHYHRYHAFDNAKSGENIFIKGIFHTVQPVAVESTPVYTRNSREYTILETENFGKALFMQVGAMMVGRIVNYHSRHAFKRGEEMGRFEFGGSTIILLLKENTAKISEKILVSNKGGIEFPVKAGEKIGEKI